MPKIKVSRGKKAPKGFEEIEPTLQELYQQMRDAENEPIEGKRKPETVWPIFRLTHQMSRYVYDLFYKKKEMSREVYEYCLKEKWADAALIAKWKKSGFERLCCVQCINKTDSQFGTGCICRVPKDQLDEEQVVECVKCGCRGCASGDV